MSQFVHKYDRTVFGGAEILSSIGSSAANAFWGRTAVVSDTVGMSAVVSTAIVNSSSLILFGVQNQYATGSNTTGMAFAVATVSPGNFFRFATVGSTTAVGSFTVMWTLLNPTA